MLSLQTQHNPRTPCAVAAYAKEYEHTFERLTAKPTAAVMVRAGTQHYSLLSCVPVHPSPTTLVSDSNLLKYSMAQGLQEVSARTVSCCLPPFINVAHAVGGVCITECYTWKGTAPHTITVIPELQSGNYTSVTLHITINITFIAQAAHKEALQPHHFGLRATGAASFPASPALKALNIGVL